MSNQNTTDEPGGTQGTASDPLEKIPDIEVNTPKEPTFEKTDNDLLEVGKIEFTGDKNKKRYKFTMPPDAMLSQVTELFNSLMTFHVDEDHPAYALVKAWGWKMEEDLDGEPLTT